ncbi:MAG: CRISPR-associated protein Csx16 [Chloroflexota bacterium]
MDILEKLEAALNCVEVGRRKSSKVNMWGCAEEAAQIGGVKVHRNPANRSQSGVPDWDRLERDIRHALTPTVIIVSRHAGAVEWLRQRNITGDVLTHVSSPEEIRGKTVVGALPLHLAAEAAKIGAIDLPLLSPDQRGRDLSPQEMDRAGATLTWYEVRRLS